mgnify:CR=1 FL=1
MASVHVAKDNHSLVLINLLADIGDKITYDWSLTKSYTIVITKGAATIQNVSGTINTTREAFGLYRVPPSEDLVVTATESQTNFLALFRLDDDDTMNELLPSSTVTLLRAAAGNIIPFISSLNDVVNHSGILSYISGDQIFTLSNLDLAILAGV